MQFYLAEKKEKIAAQISKEKNLMDEISKHLQRTKKMEAAILYYEFETKEITATKVASVRFKGSFQEQRNENAAALARSVYEGAWAGFQGKS